MNHKTRTIVAVLVWQAFGVQGASAETDRKIVSALVCQPADPTDRENLQYSARGVVNIGKKDIELNCPIIRDSTASALDIVEVFYQRSLSKPNRPDWKFLSPFEGKLISCAALGDKPNSCDEVTRSSSKNSVQFVAKVEFDPIELPHGNTQYYVYKTQLPPTTVLRAIIYTEKVK
jgi:hypothetical protein